MSSQNLTAQNLLQTFRLIIAHASCKTIFINILLCFTVLTTPKEKEKEKKKKKRKNVLLCQ
jgi:hypothetical protein